MRKVFLSLVVAVIVPFVLIQLVPYGHDHSNPPVQTEVNWGSQQVQELAVNACYDCHSNQTVWPWYSNIAPISWFIQRDVDDGRRRLDFSTLNQSRRGGRGGFEAGGFEGGGFEGERGNSMPPWYYVLMHPEANLTSSQRAQLDQVLRNPSWRVVN